MSDAEDISIDPKIEASWREALASAFASPYFKDIKRSLLEEMRTGAVLYPPARDIFKAFNMTPFDQVKVVILGQDPYHGKGQAHGLSFSVPLGITPPPSLVNIFKEVENDLGIAIPTKNNATSLAPAVQGADGGFLETYTQYGDKKPQVSATKQCGMPGRLYGNLEPWATQGVLLLNALLTVRAGEPASHRHIGWETFTDAVIKKLSDEREHLVFILWGKFAQTKESLIDAKKHLILTAPHPSPYSASSGFFGCKHFSKTNEYLKAHGKKAIRWEEI